MSQILAQLMAQQAALDERIAQEKANEINALAAKDPRIDELEREVRSLTKRNERLAARIEAFEAEKARKRLKQALAVKNWRHKRGISKSFKTRKVKSEVSSATQYQGS
jgi:predicted RNase H-like nuclease (RuvC/YqgF family)